MSTLILQDGPFLSMRLYIMVGRNVIHQMIVFFTCKNMLVVILQFYRLTIIATAKKDDDHDDDDPVMKEINALKNFKSAATVAVAKSKFIKSISNKIQPAPEESHTATPETGSETDIAEA